MTQAPAEHPRESASESRNRTLLDRRGFLAGAGGLMGALATARLPGAWAAETSAGAEMFTLGIASGDPLPEGVVLWTRLAPNPLVGGGMPFRNVEVGWQVASDDAFHNVVRAGVATARPRNAHSVHVDVRGLKPEHDYWYRFKVAGEESHIGHTRTTPASNSHVDHMRFAFASCQQYEHGYFTAYKHMANEDLDLVIHLGDYIYEYPPDVYVSPTGNVRRHNDGETISLASYRNRHALYKTDPDLQAAHARFPFTVTWDDHEAENNYADEIPEEGSETPSQAAFLRRRAAAYRAYWEHMPLRVARPQGAASRIYRRLRYGDLATFNVLDTRQYRSNQPCGDDFPDNCQERFAPEATITGPEQERWLRSGLQKEAGRWNVLAQQIFMAQIDLIEGPKAGYYVDGWDGYVRSRNRLLRFLHQREVTNPIVLTGDWHANWLADLKPDYRDPSSPTVGTEFVGTSISSTDVVGARPDYGLAVLRENPHIKYFNNQRGYVRCDLTPERWRADYRVVPYVTRRGAPVETAASFVVENGKPEAQRL